MTKPVIVPLLLALIVVAKTMTLELAPMLKRIGIMGGKIIRYRLPLQRLNALG